MSPAISPTTSERSARRRRHIGPIAFPEPRQLIPLLITWGVSVLILISQRDLGASLLLFVGFVLLLYAATGTTGYLVAGGFLGVIAGVASYLAFDHVQRRVIAWIAPFEHYEDEGFQIAQGLFAMGTGSLSGAGPGSADPISSPTPPPTSSSLPSVRSWDSPGRCRSSRCSPSPSRWASASPSGAATPSASCWPPGLTFVLAVQTILIIGGVVRLVPLTGITLPFMSYGGSALVGNMILIALLLRISHEEAP